MYLQFGPSYSFPVGAASIVTDVTTEWAQQTGRPISQTHTWDVQATLVGTIGLDITAAQAEMKTLTQAFEAAMRQRGVDLVLYQDNGQPSAMQLRNRGSLTGVRVLKRGDPGTEGAENATFKTVRVQFTSTYPWGINADGTGTAGQGQNTVLSFQETLEFSGGEPVYDVFPSINGNNQEQLLFPISPYVCTQSGQATGYLDYPKFPPPLFQHGQIRRAKTGGEQQGNALINWGIRWNYSFKSVKPLIADPTVWRNP